MSAAEPPAIGSVITHASTIGLTIFQLASRFRIPMPSTAPMRMCVDDTGIPSFVASRITVLAASSALKPVVGRISASLLPMVAITYLPKNQSQTTNEMPKVTIAMPGTGAVAFIEPVFSTSRIAAKGPTAFAMSLAP